MCIRDRADPGGKSSVPDSAQGLCSAGRCGRSEPFPVSYTHLKQGDLQTVWKQSAETVYKGTPLTAKDLQLVCYPGTFLGQTDCENQARQFQYLETRLQVQLQEAEEVYRTKGPLQRRIGFFAGALLAVVLL